MKANKITSLLTKLYAVILISFVTAFSSPVFSQVDFEFWFAAPYASMQHNPNSEGPGGRPIYMRIATQDAPANVVLSMPANQSFIPISIAIPANQASSIDLTPYLSDIMCSNQGNVIENKAIYIKSDALITAYYEISSVLNGDFFSLKGKNALGTDFYAPTQNKYYNSDWHNINHNDPYGLYTVADPAYSYIIIAATANNTVVNITPTGDAVGISAGTTKSIVLNKGETYVVRSVSSTQMPRLGGTHITSQKKIAVTIGDDSMFPQDYTTSNDCEDYAGDQIVPTNVIGKEYWVVKGQGAEGTYTEHVFVTATMPNTIISVDGNYVATINAGQQVAIDLGDATAENYRFIKASEPVYAFQISGYQCEMAGAILPPVDKCTGSYKTGFYRTYGTDPYQNFWMNLMVRGDGEDDFLLDGVPNTVIQNATFQTITGSDWKVARIEFSQTDLPAEAHYITNTTSLFHMGMMNSRSFDWGSGYGLMGASFAYFSNFNDNQPRAIIVNNNDTAITVARGTRVSLFGDGGYAFNWTGYLWNGIGWDVMTPPYFMNQTNVENPYVILNADGVYKYTASISTECYGIQNRSVYIKIVPPANLNDIYDTLCATPPSTTISEFYNLYNLNDTIVGRQGQLTGYFVDRWYKWVDSRNEIWDDFETNRNVQGLGLYTANPLTPIANPSPTGVNTSTDVLYLKKTGTTDPPGMNFYGFDPQLTRLGVQYDIDLSANPISLAEGKEFSFDIMFDGTVFQGWELPANYNVSLQMIDGLGTYATVLGGMVIATDPVAWNHLTFDFTGYESMTEVTKARIVISKSNSNWANTLPGFYIDNIERFVSRHQELIEDPYQYRVTHGDTILALVLNHFDVTRIDTASVYFAVDPPGMGPNYITISDTCATSGNYIEGFDLTNYNYDIGGALVADRIWYLDAALTTVITDPTDVTVSGTQTFWAKIEDECGGIGSLTIEVSPTPNVMDGTVQICENVALGGDRGILDLSTMANRVTANLDATIRWYSDAAMTQLVPDITQVFAEDGDIYYAEIYYNLSCRASAQLEVSVIPLDNITIAGFTVCYDGGVRIMTATPAGGTFTGTGVTGNQFNPITAGVGTHEISYTISNQGCSNTSKVNAIVAPLVTATIVQVPAGKLQVGESATLNTTITPAPTSNYNFVWTDAANLTNPLSLSPTTVALSQPTNYCIVVTDRFTGCDDTVCTLVDVYVPVTVDLVFSANPVCAGTPVTVTANRTGGFGPYTYNWTIPLGTDYTMINDSVVRLNNPQANINLSVSVTDIPTGDIASDTDMLTVHARPTVTIADVTPSVCQNAPLSINPTVSGGLMPYTHLWSQDTQILTTATNVQNATVNTTANVGIFYLRYTVTDANNCTDTEDVTVDVNPKPVVTAIANPDTTCVGQNVNVLGSVVQGVTAGGTHSWLSPSGSLSELTSTTIPNPVFQTFTYGVHRFEYIFTDANGCKDTSDIVRIRIEPKPVVTIDPIAAQCASNMSVPLHANPTVPDVASPTFTYNWTGAVTSTDESPFLDITSPGTKNISLTVTANNGCTSDPASISVVVNPNPVAQIINPEPLSVCAGADLALQANPSPGIVYTWDGTARQYITPTTGANVTFNAPSVNPSTVYNAILIATNSTTGCIAQDNVDITVYKLPQVTLGNDLELCVGSTTTLNPQITYVFNPSYTIRWVLDTTELSNTGTLNPLFTQRELRDYTVGIRITDVHNCEGYDDMTIHGLANPIANAGNDTIVDWSSPFNLNGSATAGTPTYTWAWEPQDSLTSVNTVSNPSSILQNTTWFELEVTDAKGCTDIDSVLVTVVGQPINVHIVQHPTVICFGESGNLEAIASGGTGVYTYEWYEMPDATTVIGTDKFLPITPSINTQYMVRVSSGSFTPATATYNVVVYPLPTLSIINSENKEICLNSSVLIEPTVLGGTGPYDYEWNDGGPFVFVTPTYLYNNSSSVGLDTIHLTVTDYYGCEDVIDVIVTVNGLPQVTIVPVDPSVCVNNDLILTAQVTGGESPFSYAWIESSGHLTQMGSTALFNSSIAGPYTVNVLVTDQNSCAANTSEIVIVKPLPTMSLDDRYTACAGENLPLDINPNNIPGIYTMHWIGGDRNLIVDSTDILKSIFRSNDEGIFELYYSIADGTGCPRVDTVEIEVFPAVQIAVLPDLEACVGVTLPIEANVISAGNPATLTYSWIVTSGLGSLNPTYGQETEFSASIQGITNIKVIAGDANCSDSTSFTVSVHPNPIVEITTNVQATNVPYASNVELFGNILVYTSAPTYSWDEAAAIISGQGTAVATTIPITQTREYTFTIVDTYGCTASDQITLSTEDIVFEIKHPCNPTIPIQSNVIVDGSVVCLDYENEICMGESIRLVPQFISGDITGLTYSWTDQNGTFISNQINPLVTPTQELTIYTLTVTNPSGYSKSASFLVVAHPLPTASILVSPEYNGNFYINSTLNIDGNPQSQARGAGETHTWVTDVDFIFNTNSEITYIEQNTPRAVNLSYTYVDLNSCSVTATRTINVITPVIPNINIPNVCEGETVTYSLDRTYPPGTIYVWTVNGGQIVGSSDNSTLDVLWPTANPNATVSVYVQPPNDLPVEQSITVSIGTIPNVSISGPVHVCQGDIVDYTAINNTSSANLTYFWNVATDISDPLFEPYYSDWWDGINHELLTAISLDQTVATVTWRNVGQDKVVLSAVDGTCFAHVDLDVTIHALPQPDFSYESVELVYFQSEDKYRHTDSIYKDKQVDFTNLTVDTSNVSFFWDFVGDGVFTENSFETSYEFDESGNFMVQLMAVDDVWGCRNIIAKPLLVIVNPNCGLTFPNAFTPDLTTNGTFYPVYNEGVLETGYELKIYNRWGALLWTTTDKTAQWDGMYKGELSKQDVYVYHCKAVCEEKDPATGKERVLNIKGDVTVIR